MIVAELIALLLAGALVTEGAGYLWHRWVCHTGILRFLLADVLRRRHFDHHVNKYPIAGLRHDRYSESCDIAFQVLGVGLVVILVASAVVGWIRLYVAITLLLSLFGHAYLGTKLHALYHVSDRSACSSPIFKWRLVWSAFSWLRDFHDVHHVANANYSLVFPLFDLVGGTYISPRKLSRLQAENLFPQFDSQLSGSCEKSLF